MTRLAMLSAALVFASPLAAQAPQPTPILDAPSIVTKPGAGERSPAEAARKVVRCEGEQFVFAWGAGSSPTRVTLCSEKDAGHEDVVRMLEDAARKLEQTSTISEERRTALVHQIRGKIAELEKAHAAQASAASRAAAEAAASPAGGRAAPAAAASAVPSSALLLPKPRLSFECYTPGDIGIGGPCTIFNRDTRITIKAGEEIPAATSLRFTRRGEFRTEVRIGPIRKGRSIRLILPRQVCGGVVETEIEIQVARGGYVVDSRGPFLMRC